MARKKRNQFDVDEIYRGLRTNIEFSQMDDAIQVINVVSTIANEGKSTVACNLARIMAAKYKSVLLIGIIFIPFEILLPVTLIEASSAEIVSSCPI